MVNQAKGIAVAYIGNEKKQIIFSPLISFFKRILNQIRGEISFLYRFSIYFYAFKNHWLIDRATRLPLLTPRRVFHDLEGWWNAWSTETNRIEGDVGGATS